MSTRAVYTFKDADDTWHVYRHSDGYPSGAAYAIEAALPHAWPLPRFEADEFAAAFVAGNKSYRRERIIAAVIAHKWTEAKREIARDKEYAAYQGGGVRLTKGPEAHGDIEYRYEVTQGPKSTLFIRAFSTDYWDEVKNEKLIFEGSLEAFKTFASKSDA